MFVYDNLTLVLDIPLGYSVDELLDDGCTSRWFQRICENSAVSFRSVGYKFSDLIKLGYKIRLLNKVYPRGERDELRV